MRGFWWSSSKDWYFKWNILLQCMKNCSAARTGKSLVTPLHAGEKTNWVTKNSIRGTDEQNEKETKSIWGEKKHRLTKGGTLTIHHRDLQKHSHLPRNELDGQTQMSASGKGAWPCELPPAQDPGYCLSFRQMQTPIKAKPGPDPLIILSISFPSFELFISASHRTFPFDRGDSCRKKLWGGWLALLPVAELPLE